MNVVDGQRYWCRDCKKPVVEYADGTLRCEHCRTYLTYQQVLDKQRPTVKPRETGIKWTTYTNI